MKIQDRICVQMLKQTEGCEKQMYFISLIPYQTIYAFLLRISKCREIRVFLRILLLPQELQSRNFLTNTMYGYNTRHQTGGF